MGWALSCERLIEQGLEQGLEKGLALHSLPANVYARLYCFPFLKAVL